jgi:hypothetical protein
LITLINKMMQVNLISKFVNYPNIFIYFSQYLRCLDIKNILFNLSKSISKCVKNGDLYEYYLNSGNCYYFNESPAYIFYGVSVFNIFEFLVEESVKKRHLNCIDALLKTDAANVFKNHEVNCSISIIICRQCKFFSRLNNFADMDIKIIKIFIRNGFDKNKFLLTNGIKNLDEESIRIAVKNYGLCFKKLVMHYALRNQKIKPIIIFNDEGYRKFNKEKVIEFKDIIGQLLYCINKDCITSISEKFIDNIFNLYHFDHLVATIKCPRMIDNICQSVDLINDNDFSAPIYRILKYIKEKLLEFKELKNYY